MTNHSLRRSRAATGAKKAAAKVNAATSDGEQGPERLRPIHGISAIDWKLALYSRLANGTAAARTQHDDEDEPQSGLGRGSLSPVQSASPTNVSGTT